MKKVLVISFDCFNTSSSNGRALGSILMQNNQLSVSQLYIKNGTPNFIDGEYCFIDENLLPKRFFNIRKCVHIFSYNNEDKFSKKYELAGRTEEFKKMRKTPFKMLLRNIMWSVASFRFGDVIKWAINLDLDYVVVQAGDLPFLFNLGMKIAKKCKSKLIFYTSENYPLKKQNYTNLAKKSVIYPFLRRKLFSTTKRFVENASSLIFLTESLEKEFKENYSFNGKTFVVRPCSMLKTLPPSNNNEQYVFSYCGNLDLGRGETLIEIAQILKMRYKNSKLIVCGRGGEKIISKLKCVDNISYIGLVSYNDVMKIYEQSNFLLHIESFDKLIAFDSKHAFSGKIADCISCGRPFIFIGPKNMYEYQFLKDTGAALVFDSIELFEKGISSGILDNYCFDLRKQKFIQNKYFSREKVKIAISEIFEL